MRAEIIRATELTAAHTAAWGSLRRELTGDRLAGIGPSAAAADSPFLHPTYARVLGGRRSRVQICVLKKDGDIVGFFPFERHRSGVARPAGGRVCDVQAVIARPEHVPAPQELRRLCNVRVLHFEQLVPPAAWLDSEPFHVQTARHMDLGHGYDAYVEARREAGSSQIAKTARKCRKLEREVGGVEFSWHDPDGAAFGQLLDWKRAQRSRTSSFDVLQFRWVVEFLERVRATHTEDFAGVLSTLRVDGRLAAVHLGMRTETALHHWFTAYDRRLYKYSPGLILLLELAREASKRGIRRIDLGRGPEQWKVSFASLETGVATGAVDARPLRSLARAGVLGLRRWTAASSGWAALRPARRWLRAMYLRHLMS